MALCTSDLGTDHIFLKSLKVMRIFYILLSFMKSTFITSPDVCDSQTFYSFVEAVDGGLDFGELGVESVLLV